MWENRCKVAVSGVGFSKITRSADVPLAARALEAVNAAVEDSGLDMSAIDGMATYAELPASGHAIVDGISIVSVNCMMAMLKLPNLSWHIQVETVNIGGAVQQAVKSLSLRLGFGRGATVRLTGEYRRGALVVVSPFGREVAIGVDAVSGGDLAIAVVVVQVLAP